MIAAGNPASELGVHFSMPMSLRNRFIHLDLEPDFLDWCKWAVKASIRPEIIAFLRFKPALLHDPNAPLAICGNHLHQDRSQLGDGDCGVGFDVHFAIATLVGHRARFEIHVIAHDPSSPGGFQKLRKGAFTSLINA